MTFGNLIAATKRSAHFSRQSKRKTATVLRHVKPEGAGIAAHNYGWLLSHDDGDRLADLAILDSWAASLNRYCDANRVAGDLNTQLAMMAFLGALIVDPRQLAGDAFGQPEGVIYGKTNGKET